MGALALGSPRSGRQHQGPPERGLAWNVRPRPIARHTVSYPEGGHRDSPLGVRLTALPAQEAGQEQPSGMSSGQGAGLASDSLLSDAVTR